MSPLAAAALLDDPLELAQFTRWNESVGESSLRIGGMHCAACAGTVEAALRRVPGVLDARVSGASQVAAVRWDAQRTRVSTLVAAIEAAGYSAVPDTAAAARAERQAASRLALWRLFVAGFCAMQVMMLATPAYVSAPGDLAPDLKQLLDWGSWLLTLPVLAFSAWPFLAGAWRALRSRRIGMDVPVALGILVAFVASTGAAFDPGGPFGHEVWFDSLTMFVAFLLGGRWLELRARHRAEEALEDATARLPDAVLRVAADGRVERISARRLEPGDRVRVPAGQAFVADGVLLEGGTHADEALLSGESRPVPKAPGDAVVAGSINLDAPVEMRVERLGADTRYEAIVALMREARTQRPALLAGTDAWAAPFLWTVLALAAIAGAVWSVLDPSRAAYVVVAVLIVTCPCALSLAAPSALLAAAGAMGRRGLLLRRLDAVEGLAKVQWLFVDKTGTLTDGRLCVVELERLDGGTATAATPDAVLGAKAASLAAWSSHPVALALQRSHAAAAVAWRDVQEHPGEGLEALDAEGRHWRLGSPAWTGAAPRPDAGVQAVLACDGRPLARFVCDEPLRDDAREAVAALRASGIELRVVSGDAPARVARIAAELGIHRASGALTPEAKLAELAAAQRDGARVAMLGDGINDAPVLARADVSIAMGEGASIARREADAVLVSMRLVDLVHARRLAQRTLRIVRQNLVWAAVYNAVCVPLALAGWLPPWAAGLGMATSSLLVIGNSLRLSKA
jgi:Cu2+-exporting ATPase